MLRMGFPTTAEALAWARIVRPGRPSESPSESLDCALVEALADHGPRTKLEGLSESADDTDADDTDADADAAASDLPLDGPAAPAPQPGPGRARARAAPGPPRAPPPSPETAPAPSESPVGLRSGPGNPGWFGAGGLLRWSTFARSMSESLTVSTAPPPPRPAGPGPDSDE
jgi:hypothetical protein